MLYGKNRLKIWVAPIDENMRESYLRWFDQVQMGAFDALVRNNELSS
jgi:hypothetical protein